MKNVVKLEYYYSPEKLERALAQFVDFYNNHRCHESLKNLTTADVYHGKAEQILKERARIKKETMNGRRKNYLKKKYLDRVA